MIAAATAAIALAVVGYALLDTFVGVPATDWFMTAVWVGCAVSPFVQWRLDGRIESAAAGLGVPVSPPPSRWSYFGIAIGFALLAAVTALDALRVNTGAAKWILYVLAAAAMSSALIMTVRWRRGTTHLSSGAT